MNMYFFILSESPSLRSRIDIINYGFGDHTVNYMKETSTWFS